MKRLEVTGYTQSKICDLNSCPTSEPHGFIISSMLWSLVKYAVFLYDLHFEWLWLCFLPSSFKISVWKGESLNFYCGKWEFLTCSSVVRSLWRNFTCSSHICSNYPQAICPIRTHIQFLSAVWQHPNQTSFACLPNASPSFSLLFPCAGLYHSTF